MQCRSRKGQALIETAVAGMVIIPIVLFLLDVAVLVLCNMSNDEAAKNAARAAANQPPATAQEAASKAISSFRKSPIIADLKIKNFNSSTETVTVSTEMNVKLPVPFPGITQYTFVAQSVQPVLAQ